MERVKIQANSREGKGKKMAKKIRRQGVIPAVVYSSDTNISLSLPTASIKTLRSIHFSESAVIDMEITDGKREESIPVIIKDVQFHPLTEKVIHIDFFKVSLKKKIKVPVPLVFKGESRGVKDEEGNLEQILREIEIEGLPLDIPNNIEVDISDLGVGQSIHAKDLQIAQNLKIITDPGATLVTVTAKVKEEVEEVAAVEEGAAPTEPEVIREKKEAAEGAAPKEEGKKEKKG
jgi:large subunit ribosomal protein L25